MMDHMTEVSGLSWPRRILNTLQNDDRLLAGGAAFLGGLMTAMGRITGEVAPFGVAYAAAAPCRMTVPALLGAALGYLLMAAPPAAWQYPLAALLAVGLRQLLAVSRHHLPRDDVSLAGDSLRSPPLAECHRGTYWFGRGGHPARSIPPPTGV